MLDAAIEHLRANREQHLEQLKEFLSFPTISTLSENEPDIQRCASWLADALRGLGFSRVEVMATPGLPIVYGERVDNPDNPTILVYGHYDVQPVDPLDEWNTPPFEPTIVGDDIFARGSSDMKGSIFASLKAIEAIAAQGALPVNVKYLIEGEEEVGSKNLSAFIDEHIELLACDLVLNCDGNILTPEIPAITYALRGLAYFEVEVEGPSGDLHSGSFGGTVHNPIHALCELIAGMHDEDGRITLPGFYDKVRPIADEERAALAKLPHTDEDWLALTGAPKLMGEKGYTTIERAGARPSLDANGIVGGFISEGSKTVLPARAMAKISMRLVPDQDETEILDQLREYMRQNAPDTIKWKVREHAHGTGSVMQRDSKGMQAMVKALTEVFGVEPVFRREGGSVPVVGEMQKKLGVDSILTGCGLPDDNIHAPNEKMHLPNFYKFTETYARFMFGLSD